MKSLPPPSTIADIRLHLKSAFDKIKLQFEEHLEAINENTNEIQANYHMLKELEEKMGELHAKIESIQLHLSRLSPSFEYKNDVPFDIQPLSINEKRLLQVLLATSRFLSYGELAKTMNLSVSLIRSYVTNLIGKGVPVIKKYLGGKPFVTVDEKFRELQEREDIAHLGQRRLDTFSRQNI